MRRSLLLFSLALIGCAGPDSDAVDVATRFHALRIAGDDPGVYALLTDADRAAFPLAAFPTELPAGAMLELLGWGSAAVESAAILDRRGDTADVLLSVADGRADTLRLVATHDPLRLWLFERDRVRWRVSMGLAERATVDSLAARVRSNAAITDSAAVAAAAEYLAMAERYPAMASAADVATATSFLRRAAVADSLRIDLRLSESRGVPFVEGHIENPTAHRIGILRVIVRDAAGQEDRFELWNLAASATTPVRQLTALRRGPLTYRLERIQVN